jgi:hypothetical protein
MKQDRFLIGILIFIGVLVIVSLAMFFIRQESRDYGPEDTPEGVVYNYVLAIEKGEFERAYGYLAEENKPSYDSFMQNFYYVAEDAALEIQSSRIEQDQAWVSVVVHYTGTGPFDTGWSSPDTARLVKEGGRWKLIYMPSPYWGWNWYQSPVEPVSP